MTDVSNYEYVTFRVKATDTLGGGGNVNFQPFFQFVADVANLTFQPAGLTSLAIDGQWHVLTYPLAGITGRHLASWTGINLGCIPIRLRSMWTTSASRYLSPPHARSWHWQWGCADWAVRFAVRCECCRPVTGQTCRERIAGLDR